MNTEGMVMPVAGAAHREDGSPSLLTMITPIAPARCALRILSANVQVPRSITAILPARRAATAAHASAVGALPSFTSTAMPR